MLSQKHLLGLENVKKSDIELLLDTAESFKEIMDRDVKKVPTLRGKSIVNLFYEPRTRTRTSFELAGKYLMPTPSTLHLLQAVCERVRA